MTSSRFPIAHVVLSLEPGGLERFICNLTGCPTLGDTAPVVYCLDERGALATVVEEAGGRVVLEPRGPGFDCGLILRLFRHFRRSRVAAVHTHSLDPMLYVAIAAALARIPVRIHTQHNTFLDSCSRLDRWKFRFASLFFTHLIAVSEQTRRGMLEAGASAARTTVVVNGIDETRFRRSVAAPPGRPFRIGCIARLSREKGIDRLLRAFAVVHRERPETRLVLAGDGPERTALEQLAAELCISHSVEFLGYTSEVERVLGSIDTFVLPSLTEGVPLAALEAMAAGLPVIASRVGGLPEILADGESGILVPAGDVNALAVAITRLVDDAPLRDSLGRRAREAVERRYSLSAMATRYRAVYFSGDFAGTRWSETIKQPLRRLPTRLMLWRSDRSNAVSLTFDDGPDEYTPRILDLLRQNDVRATFFLVGNRAAANEAMVRRILDEGHEIGNHSYSHPDFEKLSLSEAEEEIQRTQAVLERIQGKPCRAFRPPKGKLCFSSLLPAWRRRMTVVLWSIDLKDFRARAPEEILSTLRRTPVRPGDVILYHGNNEVAFNALGSVIKEIRRSFAGRVVPLSELHA